MSARYEELLAELKKTEWGFERLALIDEEMLAAAIAWRFVEKTVSKKAKVERAWDAVKYNEEEWADLSQLSVSRLKKAVKRLVQLNLIFPDGSLPKEVKAFAAAKATEHMGVKVKKKVGR